MSDFTELRLRKTEGLAGTVERRTLAMPDLEIRDARGGSGVSVSGYAALTETPAEIGDVDRGGFVETIARGAFKRTLTESPDVVLNAQHGRGLSGLPLARSRSGTLTLSEDDTGLWFEADLDPSDPDIQTLVPKMRRGDLGGASFAFRVTNDTWTDDRSRRRIGAVTLHHGDVSIVDFPAYAEAYSQLDARRAERRPPLNIGLLNRRDSERIAVLRGDVRPARRPPGLDSRTMDDYRGLLERLRAGR